MTAKNQTDSALDALLAETDLDTETMDVDGIGQVTIRSLTRQQAVKVADAEGGVEREVRILAYGLAEPKLTLEQAATVIQRRSAGQIQGLMEAISRLSGLMEDSQKEARSRFRDEPVD